MKAVITVVGKDTVGILAKVSNLCAEKNINIIDVTQTVMQELFCMIMLTDVSKCSSEFSVFAKACVEAGEKSNLDIRVMHEDIFNTMHNVVFILLHIMQNNNSLFKIKKYPRSN